MTDTADTPTLLDLLAEREARYPRDGAVARLDDPDTSHEAAASVRSVALTRRAIIDLLHAHGDMTDEELVTCWAAYGPYPQTPQSIRSRRAELANLGLVEQTGEKRPTRTGRAAYVWRIAQGVD